MKPKEMNAQRATGLAPCHGLRARGGAEAQVPLPFVSSADMSVLLMMLSPKLMQWNLDSMISLGICLRVKGKEGTI